MEGDDKNNNNFFFISKSLYYNVNNLYKIWKYMENIPKNSSNSSESLWSKIDAPSSDPRLSALFWFDNNKVLILSIEKNFLRSN